MERLSYITMLENNLKACVSLESREKNAGYWMMKIHLFYDGEPAGVTSFNLHGYTRQEAEAVAQNIASNQYLMKEIDMYLWGESD